MIDRFTRRSKQAYAIVPAISLVLAIPFYIGFVWASEWETALLFLIGPTFLNYFYLSSSVTLVQQEVRPDQRVMSGALLLLVMNLIGLGFGPTYVGAASDFIRSSCSCLRAAAPPQYSSRFIVPQQVRRSWTPLVSWATACICLWRASSAWHSTCCVAGASSSEIPRPRRHRKHRLPGSLAPR